MGLRRLLRQLRFGTDLPYRVYDRLMTLHRALEKRQPLRRPADDALPTPFFIVGSGRSGNTLLRAILCGHGELAVPPESYVLGVAVREYRKFGFLSWPELVDVVLDRFASHPQFAAWDTDLAPVRAALLDRPDEQRSLARMLDAVYRAWASAHMPGARRWGDKTPTNVYHLPRLDAVFPDAIYVHMLRDGRDVVASYLEAGLSGCVEEACERWQESVRLVRRFARRVPGRRFLEIRYERLVREPETVVRKVCGHLEVDFEPAMLNHRERIADLGDTDARHHAGLDRAINDASVGSWRDRLDSRQKSIVRKRLAGRLVDLGNGD